MLENDHVISRTEDLYARRSSRVPFRYLKMRSAASQSAHPAVSCAMFVFEEMAELIIAVNAAIAVYPDPVGFRAHAKRRSGLHTLPRIGGT